MTAETGHSPKGLCVIGDPVLHSKSPAIHNGMIREFGLDYIYLCQPVPKGEAGVWLERAAKEGYAGFNATMPHKEALFPLMDQVDDFARMCGAVNTVCIRAGKYYGYNTDGPGFLRALEDMGLSPRGRRVLLLGAGGAAKSVALALAFAGAEVTVCNRTVEKAEELCKLNPEGMRAAGFENQELCKLAARSDLLVNGTSLGMEGAGPDFGDLSFLDALPEGAAVYDLIYHPAETSLLKRARELGHPTANGMGMLLHQAILALEHFTGQSLDRERAKGAALKGLQEN